MRAAPSQQELEAAHCWEADDRVPGRPAMTAFRQTLRYHQAQWREANGHPIGSQPIVPRAGKPSRPFGSRLPLDYAKETGATFVTAGALEAARARTSFAEPHQSFDHQRLWAELLWSATLAFNLFGDLAADLDVADRAVHAWWPDAPGTVSEVRFAHSPGRFDPEYLGSLRAFAAAFVLDLDDGTRGIVGIDTKYHEHARPATRKPIGPAAAPGGRREVGRLPAGRDRGGRPDRPARDVARAPAAAVDAAAPERRLELGPLRRRPPRRQHRLRRCVRPLPRRCSSTGRRSPR